MDERFRTASVIISGSFLPSSTKYESTYFTFFQSAGTRIRLSLMWAVVDAIKTPTSECWVNQNASKPTLQVVKSSFDMLLTVGSSLSLFLDLTSSILINYNSTTII